MEPIGIAQELRKRFNDSVSEITSHRGQVAVLVERTPIVEICRWLKTDYQMNHLNCLCGVDNRNRKAPHGERFEVVYQLYSIPNRVTLRLKAQVRNRIQPLTPSPPCGAAPTGWNVRPMICSGLSFMVIPICNGYSRPKAGRDTRCVRNTPCVAIPNGRVLSS